MGSVYRQRLKSGGMQATWKIKYYVNGVAHTESTGLTSETEARRILKEREGRVATGQPILPRADKILYGEGRTDLMTHYETKRTRDLDEAEDRLAHLDAFFTGSKLVDIHAAAVEAYAKRRLDAKAAPGTINREIATLVTLLRRAHANRKLLAVPSTKDWKLAEAAPRAGFVTRAQFDAIMAHLPLELQGPALIAFTYGWRKREVLDLQHRHLDLEAGTLRLDPGSTKSGEGRIVHLTDELVDVIAGQVARVRALERERSMVIPWLFPHLEGAHAGAQIVDPRKVWAAACSRAGLPGILFHDLRRSAVRELVGAGVPERVAMTMTGHRTRSVFDRYHIVSAADLKDAARRLGKPITEAREKTATAAGQVRFQVRS